jgi:hypothetical protein
LLLLRRAEALGGGGLRHPDRSGGGGLTHPS